MIYLIFIWATIPLITQESNGIIGGGIGGLLFGLHVIAYEKKTLGRSDISWPIILVGWIIAISFGVSRVFYSKDIFDYVLSGVFAGAIGGLFTVFEMYLKEALRTKRELTIIFIIWIIGFAMSWFIIGIIINFPQISSAFSNQRLFRVLGWAMGGSNSSNAGLSAIQRIKSNRVEAIGNKTSHTIEYGEEAKQIAQSSHQLALKFGHSQIDIEHLLLALIEQPNNLLSGVFDKLAVSIDDLRNDLSNVLTSSPKSGETLSEEIRITPRLNQAIKDAGYEAQYLGNSVISPIHIFLGIIKEKNKNSAAAQILRKHTVTEDRVIAVLKQTEIFPHTPVAVNKEQRVNNPLGIKKHISIVSITHFEDSYTIPITETIKSRSVLKDGMITKEGKMLAVYEDEFYIEITGGQTEVIQVAIAEVSGALLCDNHGWYKAGDYWIIRKSLYDKKSMVELEKSVRLIAKKSFPPPECMNCPDCGAPHPYFDESKRFWAKENRRINKLTDYRENVSTAFIYLLSAILTAAINIGVWGIILRPLRENQIPIFIVLSLLSCLFFVIYIAWLFHKRSEWSPFLLFDKSGGEISFCEATDQPNTIFETSVFPHHHKEVVSKFMTTILRSPEVELKNLRRRERPYFPPGK